LVVKYAELLLYEYTRYDNDERRNEKMLYDIRKLHFGALQFKVTVKRKEYTWHKMPMLPTLDAVGLKIAVTTV
jgi:hypothetical protein